MPLSRRRRATELLGLDPATNLNRSWLYGVASLDIAPLDEDDQGQADRPTGAVPSSSSQAGPPPRHPTGPSGAGHASMAHVVASPHGLVGHATEPQQRVMQVSLGSEHGVLLTDAAIVFSWGDNRYGQLGRVARFIEEDGRPFPVLGMLGEEVVQVAAGKHHCLVLSASGHVWSWGRNKAGQLGCGDFKDRVAPEQVRHEPDGEHKSGCQLGARRSERITGISAGGASSVACGLNSAIWQWGEITVPYAVETAQPKSRTHSISEREPKEHNIFQHRPFCVFKRESYRTRMRRNKISLSETARQVLTASEDVDRLKELVDHVCQLKEMIAERRSELARMEREKKKRQEKRATDEVDDMGDTLAVIEQEISAAEVDIHVCNKNLESCDRQQVRFREQLQQIIEHTSELSEREDQLSIDLIDEKKGTQKWKDLDQKLKEFKEYIQANHNARLNILDQRAKADKEKQRLSRQMDELVHQKIELTQRHRTVKDLSIANIEARDNSDILLKFLGEQFHEFMDRFENKPQELELVSAMQDYESDHKFLQRLNLKTKEFVDIAQRQGSVATAGRAGQVKSLMQELFDLRDFWNVMQSSSWVRDDLDLACFFDNAKKPRDPSSIFKSQRHELENGDAGQAALPWQTPQLEDRRDRKPSSQSRRS